jgi:methionine--tRNA ligase beta chain
MVSFEDFKKVELKIAKILEAERVEGSEKLLRLKVSLGSLERQIIAGIGLKYKPEDLIGKEIAIVANLEPRKLMGLVSEGMLLAASGEDGPVILMPEREVPAGAEVR